MFERDFAGRSVSQDAGGDVCDQEFEGGGKLDGEFGECMAADESVRMGKVVPKVEVREFREEVLLREVYKQREEGTLTGRVVLKVARDE